MIITLKRLLYLLLLLSCLLNYGCDKDDPSLENDFDPLTGLRFISTPENQVFHNDEYQYTPEAENRQAGDMNYLLEPDGLGKSNEDVLKLFYDVRNGEEFEVTFERNFGISLTDFEDEFFDRIRNYIGE